MAAHVLKGCMLLFVLGICISIDPGVAQEPPRAVPVVDRNDEPPVPEGVEVLARPRPRGVRRPTAEPVATKPVAAAARRDRGGAARRKPEGDGLDQRLLGLGRRPQRLPLGVRRLARLPPGRRWVAGYWREADGQWKTSQWQWVPGFWTAAKKDGGRPG